ncbi:putative FlgJ-related protein [Flavobacterium arsenatis]|uniref:FlgJ-related protein n=1 Tax=Flavobacterium arsenatis TaxID=1484332 RepID=A0ABU1TLX2_9FLAO|nr:hypothetical protein [Flavobacterium arsenatis]MDR6966951.1 putative FlgJ-related protein [Flavobacterium arsenatis]
MKKLIAIALLFVGMTSFAQEKISKENRKAQRAEIEQLTPEQRNQLRLKELTLKLDLNASQQKEMAKIIAEQTTKREALKADMKSAKESNKKLTADERFVMKNKMLDEKIAMKERVKKILTPEQVEKWEKMKDDKKNHFKKGMKKHQGKKMEKK